VPVNYTVRLTYASDRRHLDELLQAIIGERSDLTYEITDSPEHGPLGLPLTTSIEFRAQRGTARALEATVHEAIDEAGLSARFARLP
jgi:hypothetical protein